MRDKKRRRRKSKKMPLRNKAVWAITVLVLVAMVFSCVQSRKRAATYQKEKQELSQEIKQLEKSNASLEEQMSQIDSDEYKEEIARERLGMVDKGEYTLKEGGQKEKQTTEKESENTEKKEE